MSTQQFLDRKIRENRAQRRSARLEYHACASQERNATLAFAYRAAAWALEELAKCSWRSAERKHYLYMRINGELEMNKLAQVDEAHTVGATGVQPA